MKDAAMEKTIERWGIGDDGCGDGEDEVTLENKMAWGMSHH